MSVYDFFSRKAHHLPTEEGKELAYLCTEINNPQKLYYFVVDKTGEVEIKLLQFSSPENVLERPFDCTDKLIDNLGKVRLSLRLIHCTYNVYQEVTYLVV